MQVEKDKRYKNLDLTHLSFADEIMVLLDGRLCTCSGFDAFAKCSGLKISMEKSTLYLVGISNASIQELAALFPFEIGQLLVR